MGIGTSIFLIAVGAILAFAVNIRTNGIDLQTVGVILMLVGVFGVILSAIFWITISYGLFKRAGQPITVSSTDATDSHPPTPQSGRLRKHR